MRRKIRRPSTRRSYVAAITVAGVVAIGAGIGMALASPGDTGTPEDQLTLLITQSTGAAPFDDTSFRPSSGKDAGLDADSTNDIVRINDTVTYLATVNNVDAVQNLTLTFTVPKGQEITTLPTDCGEGSSLLPETIAAPSAKDTASQAAWAAAFENLESQVVTCNMGDLPAKSVRDLSFTARVRPEVPNGTVMEMTDAKAVATLVSTDKTISEGEKTETPEQKDPAETPAEGTKDSQEPKSSKMPEVVSEKNQELDATPSTQPSSAIQEEAVVEVPAQVDKKPAVVSNPAPSSIPSQPADKVEPAKPAEPVEPAKANDPTVPQEPAKPAEGGEAVEPAKADESAEPVEDAEPVESGKPAGPAVSAGGTVEALAPEISQVATAAPSLGFSLNAVNPVPNKAFIKELNRQQACVQGGNYSTGEQCYYTGIPVAVVLPKASVGIAPPIGPISFDVDLSLKTLLGVETGEYAQANADFINCFGRGTKTNDNPGGLINDKKADATAAFSVRDTGTVTCSMKEDGKVNIKFTDLDSSAYTFPQNSDWTTDIKLDPNKAAIAVTRLNFEIPLKGVLASKRATSVATGTNVETTVLSSNFKVDGEDVENATPLDGERSFVLSRSQWSKLSTFISGMHGDLLNTAAKEFSPYYPAWEGTAGMTGIHMGDGVVVPGEKFVAVQYLEGYAQDEDGGLSALMCTSFDNTKATFVEGQFNTAKGSGPQMSRPSGGAGVWFAGAYWNQQSITAGSPATIAAKPKNYASAAVEEVIKTLEVEYSGGVGSAANSDCRSGQWYSNPGDVPGGVSRVRVFTQTNNFFTNMRGAKVFLSPNEQLTYAIALQANDTNQPGDTIPMWTSGATTVGNNFTKEDLLKSDNWKLSAYNPTSHVYAMTGADGLGDRVTTTGVEARVLKEVQTPDAKAFNRTHKWVPYQRKWAVPDTGKVPTYNVASTLAFRITPSLVTLDGVTPPENQPLVVEDCLPADLLYQGTTSAPEGTVSPAEALPRSPAGAGITCGPEESYLKWELAPQQVAQPTGYLARGQASLGDYYQSAFNSYIAPIEYTVKISEGAMPGMIINTAQISTPLDVSIPVQRQSKAALNLAEHDAIKISMTPWAEEITAETQAPALVWDVKVSRFMAGRTFSGLDVITALPKQSKAADGVSLGKAWADFHSAKVTAPEDGTGVEILYSGDKVIELNPKDSANSKNGAKTWCDAPVGGKVIYGSGTCPQSLSEVTGLRFLRAEGLKYGEDIGLQIAMNAYEGEAGDFFTHTARAAVSEQTLATRSVRADVRLKAPLGKPGEDPTPTPDPVVPDTPGNPIDPAPTPVPPNPVNPGTPSVPAVPPVAPSVVEAPFSPGMQNPAAAPPVAGIQAENPTIVGNVHPNTVAAPNLARTGSIAQNAGVAGIAAMVLAGALTWLSLVHRRRSDKKG
ncbi:MAG: hypothetical protein Q4G30_06235 [Actinomycetaceae bacterium]|nr:hypothetical protein [Actinomycetaceae bacterium]